MPDDHDTVTFGVPALIRLMEWAREDAPTDEALHEAAEKALKKGGSEITMADYKSIVSNRRKALYTHPRSKG